MTNREINSLNYWTKHYTDNGYSYSVDNKIAVRSREEESRGNAYSYISKLRDQAYYRYTAK